ncbi:MAG: M28 family peptidase [Planctomycetes bacterium]|nr:M28 family peptidase [Planctomycetota bacterium]
MLNLLAFAFLSLLYQSRPADPSANVQESALRATVEKLASPEFEGRGQSPGKDKARDYIISEFTTFHLKPAGNLKAFTHDFKKGRNIVGMLTGSDPKLASEFVVVSAHYDHLGKVNDKIYPGADDDATGVAAVLEIARCLSGNPKLVKRSVLFILFDLEEAGLVGSEAFVESPPVPLDKISLFITMDMIGRDTYDVVDNFLYVLGAEHASGTKEWIKTAFEGMSINPGIVGTDLIGNRSDYGPFAARKVPYLFFGTGEHRDYHKPTDTADKILYPKLTKNARIVLRCALAAANSATRPAWTEQKPDIDEVKALSVILIKFKEKGKELGLDDMTLAMLGGVETTTAEILKRGTVTAEERAKLKEVVQQMMIALR